MGATVQQLRRGMTPLIIGWAVLTVALVVLLEFAD